MDGTVFGQCRCCLSEGFHRDVMQEYSQNGTKEVYYNMFAACFNLHLSSDVGTTLICISCIHDLRNDCVFRDKVLTTEQHLLASCTNNGTVVTGTPVETTTNIEVKIELIEHTVKQEVLDCDDNYILPDSYVEEPEDPDEARIKAFTARFAAGALPRLPTRSTLYASCKQYAAHLDRLRGKIIPADKIMESMIQPGLRNKKVCMTKKMAHVSNICTILMNSNVTPFKGKNRDGFPCYYCWKMCENLQTLRNHQSKEQSVDRIKKRLKKYGVGCLVVYVDVTDLKCNICHQSIDGLSTLKDHLTKVHKKKLFGVNDRVIPFKLSSENGYECQTCKFNFETFGSIERHMNIHYRNYVCDVCGNGFVTATRLKVHVKTVHCCGEYACEVCGKVFTTRQKHKTHVDYVHKNLKKNKCPKCSERFSEYFKRQKHMVEVHGWAPLEYKCNVCDKAYDRRYHLNLHMKRSHLDVKEIQCDLCSYMCYTSKELQAHLVKHTGERTYECEVCKKSYARKKTLTEHMRIHNNDRRFACSVCGQAFVQNCSLKGHMKTHHPECAIEPAK